MERERGRELLRSYNSISLARAALMTNGSLLGIHQPMVNYSPFIRLHSKEERQINIWNSRARGPAK